MPDDAFLGSGWAFPPRFAGGGGEVDTTAGAANVHDSLRVLLATRPGERVMQESFGCALSVAMFEEVDQGLVNTLTRLVSDAVLDHEPRVRLEQLDVDASQAAEGLLRLRLDYTIRGTNSRFNMVYPFYLTEATTPGP